MNFDKPNILSNYSPAEADWGIEEALPSLNKPGSTTTSDYSQPTAVKDHVWRSPSLYTRSGSFGMPPDAPFKNGYYNGYPRINSLPNSKYELISQESAFASHIVPNTVNFHKYIKHYLSLVPVNASIVEKFRYNLIVSNLLDETLVLSKNEQALSNLLRMRNSQEHPLPLTLIQKFNFDGSILQIVDKRYRLHVPRGLRSPIVLVNTISLIIFLLKQNESISSNFLHNSRVKLFKVLLIVCTRIFKYKRAISIIQSSRTLRSLDDFMISNCSINKLIIGHMIALKEFDMFNFLDNREAEKDVTSSNAYSQSLKEHLNIILTCLLLNTKHSIRELLPFANGEILEKYCSINNVAIGSILENTDTYSKDCSALENLTSHLALFNTHRRFLICQLLTFHDQHYHNFFLFKLCDHFKIDLDNYPQFIRNSEKFQKLENVFKSHTTTLDQINELNEKFRQLHNPTQSADYANDNVLQTKQYCRGKQPSDEMFASDSELGLANLIDKLQNLTASLRFFKKYSHTISDIDDSEEFDQKLSIFSSFSAEIKSALELYTGCMNDYKAEYTSRFVSPSSNTFRSNSQRNSHNSDSFNLKSFHTSTSGSKNRNSTLFNTKSTGKLANGSKTTDKRAKKSSGGLQLGLLTVLEDPSKKEVGPPGIADDVFSNSLQNSKHESYNQAALLALTRKIGFQNTGNRFSVNSLNSNISGISELIASTHFTTDEDDTENVKSGDIGGNAEGMSKEELKQKLEESFTRIYSLENENNKLKQVEDTKGSSEEPLDENGKEIQSKTVRDSVFLNSLERTLQASPVIE